MAMPYPAGSVPDEAQLLSEELAALDELVHELRGSDPDRLQDMVAVVDERLHGVQERATGFARALALFAEPETQENLREFREQIASGEPFATVPVDQVVAEIERRRTDLGV